MKFNLQTNLVLVAFLILLPSASKAQWYNRMEIGYSYVTASAEFKGKSGFYDADLNYKGDTSVTRTIKAKAGAGYSLGLYVPLKRVGKKNMWAIDMGLVYNEFIWEGLNQGYTTDGTYINVSGFPDLFGFTVSIGAPVSIDYKIGTDAICSKKRRFGCTFGAGVIPTYNLTALVGIDGAGVGAGMSVNPFVKGEVAIFGGICWKIRGIYSFGNVPYIDLTKNDLAFTSGPFKVTGKLNMMLSLIIMPFAWHWKEETWYNTHGRYNPYL
jgi:hypothetical protein